MEEQVFVDRTGRRRGLMRVVSLAVALSLLGFSALLVASVVEHLG
ncbi:hypothetical protein ACFXGA_29870 [Actinosynnema sp. NPDC059335]